MILIRCILTWILHFLIIVSFGQDKKTVSFCGSIKNDLYILLKNEGFNIKQYSTPASAISNAPNGSGVFIVADGYPEATVKIELSAYKKAAERKLRLFIEYPSFIPDTDMPPKPFVTKLERGIITADVFGEQLKPMALLGLNDAYVLPVIIPDPLIVIGKVAGFDKAEYGITDVETHPLLFIKNNMMISATKLSNFATARYGPDKSWKLVWEHILGWMFHQDKVELNSWLSFITPSYTKSEQLPEDAKRNSVSRGVEWFYGGKFFIHPQWKDQWLKFQGDGTAPFGPPVSQKLPNGNGSDGILEGHSSRIFYDGRQEYRYWIRADVQGEVSFALAAAADLLDKKEYTEVASNLADFIFKKSNLRAGARASKDSAVYGLIGWSHTHPYVFYGDDNARTTLGLIGASAYMGSNKYDKEIVENILANFKTTGIHGFNGDRLEQANIQQFGIKHYQDRNLINPHPHFESWMWAAYLWLYDKTKYAPLLEKTKNAIRLTMEAYPDKWKWTNGIQQERARMILPLAWLVRVENTEEHRKWLDIVVRKLLENQVETGAIREELGSGKGMFGTTSSNKEYGLHEAPLIFRNGDQVSDMLYTSNFAFFSLNEAASATGNPDYIAAVNKLSDFLTRIQVKSSTHKDIDGAWFRAFDYGRWDYWASNADAGWGAWSTLTGWIQSWIVATQVMIQQKTSYWELTKNSDVDKYMQETVDLMLRDK